MFRATAQTSPSLIISCSTSLPAATAMALAMAARLSAQGCLHTVICTGLSASAAAMVPHSQHYLRALQSPATSCCTAALGGGATRLCAPRIPGLWLIRLNGEWHGMAQGCQAGTLSRALDFRLPRICRGHHTYPHTARVCGPLLTCEDMIRTRYISKIHDQDTTSRRCESAGGKTRRRLSAACDSVHRRR
jgi:hypothetical protein